MSKQVELCFQGLLAVSGSGLGLAIRGFRKGCRSRSEVVAFALWRSVQGAPGGPSSRCWHPFSHGTSGEPIAPPALTRPLPPALRSPGAGVCATLWQGTPDSFASYHILKISAVKDRHTFWLCCSSQFVLVCSRSSLLASLHPWSLPPHAQLFFLTSIPAIPQGLQTHHRCKVNNLLHVAPIGL